MTTHGGTRPGAGRIKGIKNKNTYISIEIKERLIQETLPKLKKVLNKVFELANGVYAEKQIKFNRMVVYKTLPDIKAIQFLFEFCFGKPRQEYGGSMDVNTPQMTELSDNIRKILSK